MNYNIDLINLPIKDLHYTVRFTWRKNIGNTFDTRKIRRRRPQHEGFQIFCCERAKFVNLRKFNDKNEYNGKYTNLGLTPCRKYLLALAPTGEICLFFGEYKYTRLGPGKYTHALRATLSDLEYIKLGTSSNQIEGQT